MESLAEHVLEPELTVPAPRPLTLPMRTRLLLLVAGLLLGLLIVGSGRALWEAAKLSLLAVTGHAVSGRIVEIRTEPPPAKSQPAPQSAVRYTADFPASSGPEHRSGWIFLTAAPLAAPGGSDPEHISRRLPALPRFRLGDPVPLRAVSVLGVTVCQPWGKDPGSRILALFLAGGLVLAVSLRLLRRLLRWAGSRTRLLRHGTATIGTITHTRSESEDMVRYFLRYGYSSGLTSQDCEEQVSADQWREFHVGQPVTVLFDPEQPQHAGLYALMTR